MKVYLAGPMRGLPCGDWNRLSFERAEQEWKAKGHHVISPFTLVKAMGYPLDYPCEPGTPEADAHLRHVILSDLLALTHVDAIALLPGWEKSRGATVELALAQFLGLKVYDAVTMKELTPPQTPWGLLGAIDPEFLL